jgi:uncharacterized membrane protein
VITVAGVVFSITIASLTLASQQYGPYLLRNFLRDRGNQFTLGTFLATFVYCLLVLRQVREGLFVPDLSVFCSLLLALASVGVLIYFIHHISVSLQPENLAAAVGRELKEVIERCYPQPRTREDKDTPAEPDLPHHTDQEARPVRAPRSAYLQTVDQERLVEIAVENDLLLFLPCRPGDYLTEGATLAQVWPAARCDTRLAAMIGAAFALGTNRKAKQDIRYNIDQLVQMGLIALSPAVNHTFTALICVDWLGAGLSWLAPRGGPGRYVYDGRERPRLVTLPTPFGEVVDAALGELRQFATLPVTLRLLETIANVAAYVRREEDRTALRLHADLILLSRARFPVEADRLRIDESHRRTLEALAGRAAPPA